METVQEIYNKLAGLPISLQAILAATILGVIYAVLTRERPIAGLPVVSIKQKGWKSLLPSSFAWTFHGQSILAKGLRDCPSCFQVSTSSGYRVIVPNRFAHELRSNAALDIDEALRKVFHSTYPGFDGVQAALAHPGFFPDVVRLKLTPKLGLVTDDLVDEANDSVCEILSESREWEAHRMTQDVLDLVARLSARVFLGKELCRNKEWLQISKNYTIDAFVSTMLLSTCPGLLRPFVYWLIPTCARLRKEVRVARNLIQPVVDKRLEVLEEATKEESTASKTSDVISWMLEMSKTLNRDFAGLQLSFSMAAIHTTSELLSRCMVRICETPEVVPTLREEMIRVLGGEGWTKISLYKMKLLDSFLKEVQRMKVQVSATMHRLLTDAVTLSDGTTLPAGCRIVVAEVGINPTVYPEPEKFDAARFMHMREQPGEENRYQLVTLTSDQMGFGHGQHACPGRFFAAYEMKIALCFLLLKYDFRFARGQPRPKNRPFEIFETIDPNLTVELRRREEEIDLLNPKIVA